MGLGLVGVGVLVGVGEIGGAGDWWAGVVAELLARPEVALVRLRKAGYGCYNFAVGATG